MTPQELKNSILQLAIQGKLVEQRPEEGTAQELYAQIQAEKRRLIKAGKLKKEKPLPEITEDEKPFEIPDSWMWVRFGTLLHFIDTGKSFKCDEVPPNENQCGIIKVSAVTWGTFQENESKTCYSNDSWVEAYAIHPNDFLICRANTAALVGGCVIVDDISKRLMLSDKVLRLHYTNLVYPRYVLWVLRTPLARNQFGVAATGTSESMKNISQDTIRRLAIPLPPLAEQHRIVAKIKELLPLVDRYEQAWTKLEDFNCRFPEDLKKSILQQAIQGKLVEQRPEEGTAQELYEQIQAEKRRLIKEGKIKKEKPLPEITEEEKPFEIPEGWMWVRLGQIFNLQAGKNITAANIYDEPSEKHKYLCYGGNGVRGYVSSFNREGNFALIGRQGALCGNINIAKGQFYATEHAVVVDHYNLTDVLWGARFLKALNLNQYATATAQPGLAVSNIIKVLIPLPPLAEQKRIVEKLEELLAMCERLKK